jgi:hypothetical protein
MWAKPGITLEFAERLRRHVWDENPYIGAKDGLPRDWDFNPITKDFAPRKDGVCRHKASWLKRMLGGQCIHGRRTDRPGRHTALLIKIDGRDFVLDYDRTWPAELAPFHSRPEDQPVMRK